MATAPTPGASRRAASDIATTSFKINGETYTFRFGEITGRLVKECRQATGFTPVQLFGAVSSEAMQDLDVVAALIWVARRQAGDDVDYDGLLDEVTYSWLDTFELTDDEAPEDEASPPA